MTMHFKDSISSEFTQRVQPVVDYFNRTSTSRGNDFYRYYGKRICDLFLVLALAPIALPLIAVVAALTALDGHGPFYWQRRIGRNGRTFWLMKIRTMVPDAEAKLEAHLQSDPEARREWDEKQKLSCDPRITRLGAFLRKSSLDELPQLWNVLKGEMSLVGPRPMMVEQKPLYPGLAYFSMRPGITGNWQISERNGSSFAARAKFDDVYEAAVSLKEDMGILYRTAAVVMKCTGR